ncbi:hypothetical protein PP175_21735 [Aneurinibacillus sp. Ricciae_BoGa-3]|uniref:hypothetical protein n=1 Tax=Aneurinibacillus sp. Ricciae_BoGa-3 TaxID=3022697 RepID=UPI0023421526|nr:hypothetical protein [Aneurinibacillus sp. Ricciae_BoGa-3]WCK53913.1 hypothetical protein PP175_21735 [Aneurinibacillus sp. Ricciae_BoGa-3]
MNQKKGKVFTKVKISKIDEIVRHVGEEYKEVLEYYLTRLDDEDKRNRYEQKEFLHIFVELENLKNVNFDESFAVSIRDLGKQDDPDRKEILLHIVHGEGQKFIKIYSLNDAKIQPMIDKVMVDYANKWHDNMKRMLALETVEDVSRKKVKQ